MIWNSLCNFTEVKIFLSNLGFHFFFLNILFLSACLTMKVCACLFNSLAFPRLGKYYLSEISLVKD